MSLAGWCSLTVHLFTKPFAYTSELLGGEFGFAGLVPLCSFRRLMFSLFPRGAADGLSTVVMLTLTITTAVQFLKRAVFAGRPHPLREKLILCTTRAQVQAAIRVPLGGAEVCKAPMSRGAAYTPRAFVQGGRD